MKETLIVLLVILIFGWEKEGVAFDSTFSLSNGPVYPEISDTLVYQDVVFRAYLLE